jgi:hypothetical protein
MSFNPGDNCSSSLYLNEMRVNRFEIVHY